MCGRYAASRDSATLVEEFGVDRPTAHELAPDFNVAPTKGVYVISDRSEGAESEQSEVTAQERVGTAVSGRAGGEGKETHRELAVARWGLVPSWAKDLKIGYRMINARVETLADKPAYRRAFSKRRCLLPADGYYEWYTPKAADAPKGRSGKPVKQPFYIHPADNSVLAMAGLYEFWHERGQAPEAPTSWLMTTTVITTEASEELSGIHERMPLLVPPQYWTDWLSPELTSPATLVHTLCAESGSTPAGWLEADHVGREVNSVRNNGPGLVRPLPSG